MKIAITGASGFIGKLLVKKHIDLGDEVHVLSRDEKKFLEFKEEVHLHIGDLSNIYSLTDFVESVDVLYHCAAEIRNESIMDLVNVDGTRNLIQAASGKIKHWVQLSSTGVYGPIYKGIVRENQAYNPVNQYEKTKLASDLLVLEASNNHNFTYTFIRPSNVFGFQMTNMSLFQLIKAIDKGLYFFVGNKGASANYVPVDNVIEALHLAATKTEAKNKIFIISSWCTIEKFVETIAQQLGKPVPSFRISFNIAKLIARLTAFIPKNPLTVARVYALSNKTVYETTKIEKELGYKEVTTTEKTIIGLVEFYKNNL